MTVEELQAATVRIADEAAPGVTDQGATLIVIVGTPEHWAYSVRGSAEVAVEALANVLQSAAEADEDGWKAAPEVARA